MVGAEKQRVDASGAGGGGDSTWDVGAGEEKPLRSTPDEYARKKHEKRTYKKGTNRGNV